MEYNDLVPFVDTRLAGLDIRDSEKLAGISEKLTRSITGAQVPPDVAEAVLGAYRSVGEAGGGGVRLAMRSSAVAEDRRSSFAGQYRTVLNVGEEEILNAYKRVIASKYTQRALYYRINHGLSDLETAMAVLALEMVDAKASGVIYTTDIEDTGSDAVTIHAAWGLGELLVGGNTSPDRLQIARGTPLKILGKRVGRKSDQMLSGKTGGTRVLPLTEEMARSYSLDEGSALILADWALRLEHHYGVPQDIEWAMDRSGVLFLLQTRSLQKEQASAEFRDCDFSGIKNRVLVSGGDKACSGIGAGRVFKMDRESDITKVPEQSILVAGYPSPRYVEVLGKVNAVVTDTGSTAGHFSSVAREFGVPTLVNTGSAMSQLSQGQEVTVYAQDRVVYEGIVQEMIESPCARRDLLADSPFIRKLRYVMQFVSPLRLVNPAASVFVPEGVRSLHDIIRFAHEKAVQEMFHTGESKFKRKGGAKRLHSKIPMLFYVLDVGGGLRQEAAEKKGVGPEDILSHPMKQVLKGLSHAGIHWGDFTHFDWAEYDKIVMSGGIASADSVMFSSYAVVAKDYLNLNLRFGYHFVILDTLCSNRVDENYILFRFAGGAADPYSKSLRVDFLEGVLGRLGFRVERKADLVDAELRDGSERDLTETLDLLGRLLGATRLMDMYLKDSDMAEAYVEDFMNGRYHFATVQDET